MHYAIRTVHTRAQNKMPALASAELLTEYGMTGTMRIIVQSKA